MLVHNKRQSVALFVYPDLEEKGMPQSHDGTTDALGSVAVNWNRCRSRAAHSRSSISPRHRESTSALRTRLCRPSLVQLIWLAANSTRNIFKPAVYEPLLDLPERAVERRAVVSRHASLHDPALTIELNKKRVIGDEGVRQGQGIPTVRDLDLDRRRQTLSFSYSAVSSSFSWTPPFRIERCPPMCAS